MFANVFTLDPLSLPTPTWNGMYFHGEKGKTPKKPDTVGIRSQTVLDFVTCTPLAASISTGVIFSKIVSISFRVTEFE